MHESKPARRKKRRRQKQQPLGVEIEFIGGEEAKRRWQELFKLLEAEAEGRERSKDSLNEADGPEYDQLRLF